MAKLFLKGVAIIGFMLALGVVAFALIVNEPLEELIAAEHRHLLLKEEYLSAYRDSVNLDLLRQQLLEMRKLQQSVRAILPDADGVEVRRQELEHSVRAAAARTGLESSLEISVRDSGQADFYAYRLFSVRVSGEFKHVVEFLKHISTGSEQLRMLRQVSIQPRRPGRGVTLSAEAWAFALLSDETVAAQRKAQARGEAKKP